MVGKRAGAPTGSTVTYRITGPTSRGLHVDVGERAAVVETLTDPATVTLTIPLGVFIRLGGGRISADEARGQIAVDATLPSGTTHRQRRPYDLTPSGVNPPVTRGATLGVLHLTAK